MAVAVVQKRSVFTNAASSVGLAFTSNNTAGNLLVYFSGGAPPTDTVNAATDSNTNTIANATSVSGAAGVAGNSRADYVASSNSGANTVTAHDSSTSGDPHLHIWEISGCVTVTPLRDSGTVGNSATASVSTSGTTPLSGDAVLAFFWDWLASQTLTVGSGYTDSSLQNNTVGGDSSISEFKAATAGGTQTATCGGNGTDHLSQIIVVFKATAAVSTPWGWLVAWVPPQDNIEIVGY